MRVRAQTWPPRHSLDSVDGPSRHKLDQSLRQKISEAHQQLLVHKDHHQHCCVGGKNKTLHIGTDPRRLSCGSFAIFRVYAKASAPQLRTQHMGSNLLDVQEANSSVPEQCRRKCHFIGCERKNGWNTNSHVTGLCVGCFGAISHSFNSCNGKPFARHSFKPFNKQPFALDLSSRFMFLRRLTLHRVPLYRRSHPFPCEDNEAVVKMIMKRSSHILRHVARTHRVNLERLFEQISLDLTTDVRHVNTGEQMADVLTNDYSLLFSGIH